MVIVSREDGGLHVYSTTGERKMTVRDLMDMLRDYSPEAVVFMREPRPGASKWRVRCVSSLTKYHDPEKGAPHDPKTLGLDAREVIIEGDAREERRPETLFDR